MGGRTTFRHCVIESPVNTAMFVINVAPEKEGTFLLFQVCVLNGLESCHRLIAFEVRKLARPYAAMTTKISIRVPI